MSPSKPCPTAFSDELWAAANMAAAIRQKLLNKTSEQKESPNVVPPRYGLKRFLYRLTQSPHHEPFMLKGAIVSNAGLNDIWPPHCTWSK
jgi:hypothetical protein